MDNSIDFPNISSDEKNTPGALVNERSSFVTIGDMEYELVLTTKATKEIAGRFGGLEKLGSKLLKTEHFEMALSEVVWLITLLANQGILIHNLQHKDDKKELITEELVELLTTPYELGLFKDAISTAMFKGTKRYVIPDDKEKNQ